MVLRRLSGSFCVSCDQHGGGQKEEPEEESVLLNKELAENHEAVLPDFPEDPLSTELSDPAHFIRRSVLLRGLRWVLKQETGSCQVLFNAGKAAGTGSARTHPFPVAGLPHAGGVKLP
ncbi:hypothetical protein AMECASPLE_018085 [Ameca splendens]|uniref:Uncharacterized protein n=1 Tax=Ameca splendens TaxID=208324 RepID=A0ABV0Y2N7_9TELE